MCIQHQNSARVNISYAFEERIGVKQGKRVLKRERPSSRGIACGLPGPSAGLGELGVTQRQLRKSLKFYAKESDLYFEGKGQILKGFFGCAGSWLSRVGSLSSSMWDLVP